MISQRSRALSVKCTSHLSVQAILVTEGEQGKLTQLHQISKASRDDVSRFVSLICVSFVPFIQKRIGKSVGCELRHLVRICSAVLPNDMLPITAIITRWVTPLQIWNQGYSYPRIIANSSSRFCSIKGLVLASMFKRRSGSVLDPRTLNHQSL